MEDVRPVDKKWRVTAVDKPTKTKFSHIYDALMICSGHYNDPVVPEISGHEKFAGLQCHSHRYRSPERFEDQRVLVIGAGPSGLDLALHLSAVARRVSGAI